MTYTIRRISLRSALQVGLLLGWLVALVPAAAAAGLCVAVVQQASAAFGQMDPYEMSLLGQTVASFDPVSMLGLADAAAAVHALAAQPGALFGGLTLGLTLVGGLAIMVVGLLFTLCYNLIGALGGGLRVDLRE